MELPEKITNEKLNYFVKKILGNEWQVSSLTEMNDQMGSVSSYQEWDLHLDELIDDEETDHLHKRFTLFYSSDHSLEKQLINILTVIKKGIELKKTLEKFNFYEFV